MSAIYRQEAYRNPRSKKLDVMGRAVISSWLKSVRSDYRALYDRHSVLLKRIPEMNAALRSVRAEIDSYIEAARRRLSDTDNERLAIDGLLRGWPVALSATGDPEGAVALQRSFWTKVMARYPNFAWGGRLGGIFHLDNVFFHVAIHEDHYVVTPHVMLGGDFLQLIDPERGVSRFLSPASFREVRQ